MVKSTSSGISLPTSSSNIYKSRKVRKKLIKQFILESCILESWNKQKMNTFEAKEEYPFMLTDHNNDILTNVIVTADADEFAFPESSMI